MASPVPRRVRLRPWLVAQVDSGRFPGLRWVDARRRLFVVPWHHATRHLPAHGGDDDTVFKMTPQLTPQLPPPAPPAFLEHGVPNLLASPHLLPLTDLELRFQYRGRRVSALTVSHPLGCRLSHGGSLPPTLQRPDLLGHPELQQVPFPDPEGIPHDKQRRYTRTLLGAMERGLLLELGGQDLYATRLCRCKVFWDGPCAPPQDPNLEPRPNPMERERRVQVFSLQRFLDGLILFQKGQSPTPPPFEVFLCFGEEWPDHRPREKKLVTVQ
ncbi:UNVERIFIED_CONTAM: hypothetical protein H355_000130, partial [Colinus virginianus]